VIVPENSACSLIAKKIPELFEFAAFEPSPVVPRRVVMCA
jgi:hypothetical protein